MTTCVLEDIVKDIKNYFNRVELPWYSEETRHDARRKFVKYYVANIDRFYRLLDSESDPIHLRRMSQERDDNDAYH